ncbi:MAG: PDZ domain-containing protein [Candidatus Eisenbacteria bacterium]
MNRAISICLTVWLASVIPAAAEEAWLGLYTEPLSTLPEIAAQAGGSAALRGARHGLTVTAVFPDSPAERSGLLTGDILIGMGGEPFTCSPESLQAVFRAGIAQHGPGDSLPLRVIRNEQARTLRIDAAPAPADRAERFWRNPTEVLEALPSPLVLEARVAKRQVVVDVPVVLSVRPEALWPPARENDAIYPPTLFPENVLGALFRELGAAHGVTAANEDLLARLAACHRGRDPHRLDCMIYVHRDPFRLERVAGHIGASLGSVRQARDIVLRGSPLLFPDQALTLPAARRLPPPSLSASPGEQPDRPVALLGDLIARIIGVFDEARGWHDLAFAALTDEERAFLARERWQLSDAFAREIYLQLDSDAARFRANQRVIDLAARVDAVALGEAAARLALLCDPAWVSSAGDIVRAALGDSIHGEILLDYPTSHGRLVIAGMSSSWHRDFDVAFLLDLGGDDFYTGNCGGSQAWELPLALCIDLAGDDAYESTAPGCQGSGCLGVGGLLDLEGEDEYIGLQWCQGSGYLGIGWLHDQAGDDVYRGRSFCQGVGLFGMGVLLDEQGDDRYEGDSHAQGVGLPRGLGAIVDRAGDDEYYAKGVLPTGYGDPGIFDAWSQGCGVGFRTLASGGLGALLDGGGRDRMEAGNFSQGGGYYYGLGMIEARGDDDDLYIGSRYNQGFSAHQAVGVFLEEGGADRYTTRQGVAQGLAWDECVTLFIDAAGDDIYEGGGFFSQGASAHNSVCCFWDRAGRDEYHYALGPARAGGNDYHGGTSFSLFIDEGGGDDLYPGERAANDSLTHEPEHGFTWDLPGTLEERHPGGRTR